jgi:hypothetical protein
MSLSFRNVLPAASPVAALSSLPTCASPYCPRPGTLWQRWWARREGIWLHDQWFCSLDCFQLGLYRRLELAAATPPPTTLQRNRIPLGLVLLSQGEISSSQLRQALELQKKTKSGKIGEWLMRMGAVSEAQVTAALATQQSSPVFADREPQLLPSKLRWPTPLTHQYRAVPVFHNAAANTLYVGFLEQVDHSFLYSLEHVLGCRTRPCIVPLSTYRRRMQLNALCERGESIEIKQRQNSTEMSNAVCDFAEQLRAEHCRIASCGDRLWIRLEPQEKPHLDFLFRPFTSSN